MIKQAIGNWQFAVRSSQFAIDRLRVFVTHTPPVEANLDEV